MNPIIQDSSKFSQIYDYCFEGILKYEDQINRYLYKILQDKTIDKSLHDQLYLSSSRHGILYGLSKKFTRRIATSSHSLLHQNLLLQNFYCQYLSH